MAYVDPGTFTSAVLTSSEMNVVGDDIRYLKSKSDIAAFTGVSLLKSSSQSLGSGPMTALTWDSAPIAVGGTWWTSGSTVTVPVGTVPSGYTKAVLEVSSYCQFDTSGVGTRAIEVLVNGTLVEQRSAASGIAGETTQVAVTVWAQVSDGDTVTVDAAQSSGGALNVLNAAAKIRRIGAV